MSGIPSCSLPGSAWQRRALPDLVANRSWSWDNGDDGEKHSVENEEGKRRLWLDH